MTDFQAYLGGHWDDQPWPAAEDVVREVTVCGDTVTVCGVPFYRSACRSRMKLYRTSEYEWQFLSTGEPLVSLPVEWWRRAGYAVLRCFGL